MAFDDGLSAANAAVAVSGQIFIADEDAPIPTSLTFSPETSGYTGLGYLSEDGFTITPESTSTTLRGWQNAATLRELITEAKLTASFTMVETKPEVVDFFWGTTVDRVKGSYDIDPGSTGGRKRFLFAVIDGGEVELGSYLGELTEREEITYQSGELKGYGVTVTFYPDEKYAGKTGRVFDSRLVAPVGGV